MVEKHSEASAGSQHSSGSLEGREGERSETKRTGRLPDEHPKDSEVVERAQRRRFTADYKQRILREAESCAAGEVGSLLRREGLYYSHLTTWRRQLERGVSEALKPKKRGPKKQRDEQSEENTRLQRENRRLRERLRQAEIIIEAQKKLAEVLGVPLSDDTNTENNS